VIWQQCRKIRGYYISKERQGGSGAKVGGGKSMDEIQGETGQEEGIETGVKYPG
jgi:hypothetical protein